MMSKFRPLLFVFASMLAASTSFAGEEELNPTHFSLVPSLGYHFGYSELGGTNSLSQGPLLGAGLRIERDHYFFTPDVSVQALLGLEQSPLTTLGVGFIAGGRIPFPLIDVFAGVTYRSLLSYKVKGSLFGRLGGAFNLGLSDFQFWFQGLMGQYSQVTPLKTIDYPYLAIEVGIQFPIEL